MEYNKRANTENKKKMKRYGIYNRDFIYTCVLCNKKTSIVDSFSNNGNKLICSKCAYDNFKTSPEVYSLNLGKLKEWQDNE